MSSPYNLIITLILFWLLVSCSSPPEPTSMPTARPPTPTPTGAPTEVTRSEPTSILGDAMQGEVRFHANCAPCHGYDARGADYAPSLVHPLVAAKTNDELRTIILNGRGGSMPAWRDRLNEGEINDILAFLRSRQP